MPPTYGRCPSRWTHDPCRNRHGSVKWSKVSGTDSGTEPESVPESVPGAVPEHVADYPAAASEIHSPNACGSAEPEAPTQTIRVPGSRAAYERTAAGSG